MMLVSYYIMTKALNKKGPPCGVPYVKRAIKIETAQLSLKLNSNVWQVFLHCFKSNLPYTQQC
ncbi:hypothetical protein SBF1_200018 [Candidatus Desulfosporosinus infrequens]|uniref:Uncharacterized protein n=1 Tax=Candidatus Desulfosporosinus infrequens TaxID=2043169 RepID=A0A2U3KH44_9FIRM|nr:hypothetical protein SBF1_200018 [Candidatus Desulfosporosinus infrequens]